jgi:ribonuclease HI
MGPQRETLARGVMVLFFRDDQGIILHILVDSLGHESNNVAKIWALIRGIQVGNSLGFHQLNVEGESKVILANFSKILNGSTPTKISPSWRLILSNMELLKSLLLPQQFLVPFHVR